jgi:hypothetical protein
MFVERIHELGGGMFTWLHRLLLEQNPTLFIVGMRILFLTFSADSFTGWISRSADHWLNQPTVCH